MAIGITMLFGVMTINQTAFQYIEMGLEADNSRAATLIYTISGSHIAMTAIGIIFLGLTGFRALAGAVRCVTAGRGYGRFRRHRLGCR